MDKFDKKLEQIKATLKRGQVGYVWECYSNAEYKILSYKRKLNLAKFKNYDDAYDYLTDIQSAIETKNMDIEQDMYQGSAMFVYNSLEFCCEDDLIDYIKSN